MKSLLISAPVHTVSGYGAHARDIVKSLRDIGKYNIKIIPQKWGNTPTNALDDEQEFKEWVTERLHAGVIKEQPDIFIQITVPNEFQKIGKYNIGITAGTESSLAPKEFIDGCNRMDLIIVPSTFTKKVLESTVYSETNKQTGQVIREHKIKVPVEVLFEGVSSTFTKSYNHSILDEVKEDFVFLFVGHWLNAKHTQDRKDVGGMIETFCTVFSSLPKKEQPALVLKTSQAGFSILDRQEIWKRITKITNKFGEKCPPVYLLHGDLEEKELSSLYYDSKVKTMVSFTKGEGYGRPLCEFSFTGKPIIVSNWSGHLDFLKDGHFAKLEGELKNVDPSAVNKFIIKESKWFNVNYSKAAGTLLDVWKNYESWLTKSNQIKSYNRTNFSLDNMTTELDTILKKFVNLPEFKEIKLPKF